MFFKIKTRHQEKIKHASAWISGGKLSLVRFLAGFARNKWTSVALGTVGIGLLSNGNYLYALGVTIGSLSLAPGMINRISQSQSENAPVRLQKTLSTSLTLHLLGILVVSVISLPLLPKITFWTFGATNHEVTATAIILAFPFAILASSYLEAVLFGYNRYDLYIQNSVRATLGGVILFIPLFWVYGLRGALWSIFANAFLLFILFLKSALSLESAKVLFTPRFDLKEAQLLCRFGISLLLKNALSSVAILFVRREVIQFYGPSANGLLQVPIALSAYYSPFLTNALWGKLHPTVARLGDHPDARIELGQALRANFVIGTVIVLLLLAFQHLFIIIAYSPSFVESANLIRVQMIGDLFQYGWFAFGVYFLGTSKLKFYLTGWLSYDAFWTLFSVLLMRRPQIGILGIPLSHLIVSAVLFFSCLTWYATHTSKDSWLPVVQEFSVCLAVILVQATLGVFGLYFALQAIIPIAFFAWKAQRYLNPRRLA